MEILETPVLAPLPDGNWVLLKNLEIKLEKVYFVPKGTTTDFASIPRWLWCIFPPHDYEYLRASILHDFLYRSQIKPRRVADKLFLKAMLKDGTPKWKAYLMYFAVRVFGRFAWERNKKEGEWDVIDWD